MLSSSESYESDFWLLAATTDALHLQVEGPLLMLPTYKLPPSLVAPLVVIDITISVPSPVGCLKRISPAAVGSLLMSMNDGRSLLKDDRAFSVARSHTEYLEWMFITSYAVPAR